MHLFFLCQCVLSHRKLTGTQIYIYFNTVISFKTYEIFAVMLTPSSAFL